MRVYVAVLVVPVASAIDGIGKDMHLPADPAEDLATVLAWAAGSGSVVPSVVLVADIPAAAAIPGADLAGEHSRVSLDRGVGPVDSGWSLVEGRVQVVGDENWSEVLNVVCHSDRVQDDGSTATVSSVLALQSSPC